MGCLPECDYDLRYVYCYDQTLLFRYTLKYLVPYSFLWMMIGDIQINHESHWQLE